MRSAASGGVSKARTSKIAPAWTPVPRDKQVSTPRRWAATHRMWPPLRGVLEPFSEHRLLLARDPRLALSPARPKRLFGSVGGRPAPARWRGSGRLQKRSV